MSIDYDNHKYESLEPYPKEKSHKRDNIPELTTHEQSTDDHNNETKNKTRNKHGSQSVLESKILARSNIPSPTRNYVGDIYITPQVKNETAIIGKQSLVQVETPNINMQSTIIIPPAKKFKNISQIKDTYYNARESPHLPQILPKNLALQSESSKGRFRVDNINRNSVNEGYKAYLSSKNGG